jgi:hypothetical protein
MASAGAGSTAARALQALWHAPLDSVATCQGVEDSGNEEAHRGLGGRSNIALFTWDAQVRVTNSMLDAGNGGNGGLWQRRTSPWDRRCCARTALYRPAPIPRPCRVDAAAPVRRLSLPGPAKWAWRSWRSGSGRVILPLLPRRKWPRRLVGGFPQPRRSR